jgi:hypothetical protein
MDAYSEGSFCRLAAWMEHLILATNEMYDVANDTWYYKSSMKVSSFLSSNSI